MFSVLHLLEHHPCDYVNLTLALSLKPLAPNHLYFPLGEFVGTSVISLTFMQIFPKAQCGL